MKRKYSQLIQHTIWKDGAKDMLHDVGRALERAKQEHLGCACGGLEGHLREEFSKLVAEYGIGRS